MLLPANGTEKCTSGYCNHNNTFRSSETENEMPDKHMLFLIKNGFVLCGPHHLQGYTAKAEQGRTQCLQEALLCPSCTPNTHSPGLQILCPSHAAKWGWKPVSPCCPCVNCSVLPGTARVLNVLSGYLGITSFGQNRDLVRHFCCDLALTVHLLRCEIGCVLSIFRGLNAPSADVLWTDSNLFCAMDEMRLEDKHCLSRWLSDTSTMNQPSAFQTRSCESEGGWPSSTLPSYCSHHHKATFKWSGFQVLFPLPCKQGA